MGPVMVFIAAIFCLAAGIGSVAHFVAGMDIVEILGLTVSLASWSLVVYFIYGVSNQISAMTRPPGAWGIDFFTSLIAAVGLTFSAWHVWKASPVTNVQQFFDLPMKVIGLFLATVYSWVDVSYNQVESWRQTLAALGRTLFAAMIVVVVILLIILLPGMNFPKVGERIFSPTSITGSPACSGCTEKGRTVPCAWGSLC